MEEKNKQHKDGAALKVAEDKISTPTQKVTTSPEIPKETKEKRPEGTDKEVAKYLNNEAAAAKQKVDFAAGHNGELANTSPTTVTATSERLAKQAKKLVIKRKDKNSALRIANPNKYTKTKKTTASKQSPNQILAQRKLDRGRG